MVALETFGDFGAVASTHWLATAAAMSTLERGGNAFDAATAGAFVLYVAEPDQNGLGGEVPILTRTRRGEVKVICGQGPTPAAATLEAFGRLGLGLIPGSGVLPACVPGAFDAWMVLLRDFGTWTVRDALSYATGYAQNGVPASTGLATRVAAVADHFRTHWPTSAEIYLVHGSPRPGDRLRNPTLAALLDRIVRDAESESADRDQQIEAARRIWKSGFVAEAAFRWLAGRTVTDLEGRADTVLLAEDDWADYSATVEEPVSARFGEASMYKPGPWSQGPLLLETLTMLANVDLVAMQHESVEYVHTVVEALKLAFADREAWYGDPLSFDVPVDALLSASYARERAALIGRDCTYKLRPGAPDGRSPRLPAHVTAGANPRDLNAAAARGARGLATAGDTAHISVIDRNQNVVSATPSGGWLQSSPVIPELGFPLGTRGQMMWLEEGLANSLGARKRPRTTLSATIVVRDDGRVIACGSPGGDGQDQWASQFLLGHLVYGLQIQAAADAPTFQSLHMPLSFWPRQSRPGVLQVESDLDGEIAAGLRERGHTVEVVPMRSQGWPCAVEVAANGFLSAAASPRGRNCTALVR